MNSDRELLELAAQAAGIVSNYNGLEECVIYSSKDGWRATNWNPLEDDGDAFRLAIKSRFMVAQLRILGGMAAVCTNPETEHEFRELHKGNPSSATRRAIVRAVAEDGVQI